MTQNRGAIFPRKIKNNLEYEVPNGYDELFKEIWITFLNKKERREPFKKELSVKKENCVNTAVHEGIKDQGMK